MDGRARGKLRALFFGKGVEMESRIEKQKPLAVVEQIVPRGTLDVPQIETCEHFPIITLIPGYSIASRRFEARCATCNRDLEATWKIKPA